MHPLQSRAKKSHHRIANVRSIRGLDVVKTHGVPCSAQKLSFSSVAFISPRVRLYKTSAQVVLFRSLGAEQLAVVARNRRQDAYL